MTTKFIVVDNSDYPQLPTAKRFSDEDSLTKHLTDYGIKYKEVYKVVQEMPFKFICVPNVE